MQPQHVDVVTYIGGIRHKLGEAEVAINSLTGLVTITSTTAKNLSDWVGSGGSFSLSVSVKPDLDTHQHQIGEILITGVIDV